MGKSRNATGRKNKTGVSEIQKKPLHSRIYKDPPFNIYLRRALPFHEMKRSCLVNLIVRLACEKKLPQFLEGPNPRVETDNRVMDSHTHAEAYAEWDNSSVAE